MISVDKELLAQRLAARRRLLLPPEAMSAAGFDTPGGYQSSAVLVPILVTPGEPDRLVFIERHADLRRHPGQVAFPGGRTDPGDLDATATALREACEELAIPPSTVEVLGLLDDLPTPTGYVITPVVALVRGPIVLVPQPEEVAAVFLPTVEELQDPERYAENGVREFLGVSYTMHEYRWQRWRIWGATARILFELLELVAGEAGSAGNTDGTTSRRR